jgi:thymidylate synthase ThyX
MPLSDLDRTLLAPYVTSLDSPVFVLKNLPEEVIAVLFAYYSRSREDLRANLLRLLQDQELDVRAGLVAGGEEEQGLELARRKAKEFHERWVVGYGHASVAEHAVAHVAIEDVSILASKVIEDARLAAYTEKSTRYVPFPRAFYGAPELEGPAQSEYRRAIGSLFDLYEELLPQLTEQVSRTADRSRFKTERGFLNSCQAQACDTLRYLLPAATHTNIGLTANARTLEHLISKLLSHPLAEARRVGEQVREEATKVIPTLIKYARPKEYWIETPPAMRRLAEELLPAPGGEPASAGEEALAKLVRAPEEAEARLAAAILYEFTDQPYERVWEQVRSLPRAEHERVVEEYLARRKTYGSDPAHGYTDPPLRSLEHLYFTFDILVDYGAYRDIQRHRMATQTAQRLTCAHGYDVPELLERHGLRGRFEAAMEGAAQAFARIARHYPEEAQYVVPLAFRKRVLFTWNLRALHHFVSLRSARQGHISYRRVAWAVLEEVKRSHPFLARFIRVDTEDYELARPG